MLINNVPAIQDYTFNVKHCQNQIIMFVEKNWNSVLICK